MATYEDLLPEVLPDVPGCSDPLAARAIRDAVIRLCSRSDVLKHVSEPVDVVQDVHSYAIVVPPDFSLANVLWVTIERQEATPQSQDYLDMTWKEANARRATFSHYHELSYGASPDGWRLFKQDRPEHYTIEKRVDGDFLRLVGIPTRTIVNGLEYRVSIKPLRSSVEFPGFLAEDYYGIIAKGAKGILLTTSKKPWTDMARGRDLLGEFESDCLDVKRESLKDFTRDDHAVGRTRSYS